jgi:hypothetical protein
MYTGNVNLLKYIFFMVLRFSICQDVISFSMCFRMSVGGALVAVSAWLNKLYDRLKEDEELPELASVVVL